MPKKLYRKIIITTFTLTFYTSTVFNITHAACSSEQPVNTDTLSSNDPVASRALKQTESCKKKYSSHTEFKRQFSDNLEQALDQIRNGLLLNKINNMVAPATLVAITGLSLLEATTDYLTTTSSYIKCILPITAGGCLAEHALSTISKKLLRTGIKRLLELEAKATTSLERRYLKTRLSHFTTKELKIIGRIKKELTCCPIETDINSISKQKD